MARHLQSTVLGFCLAVPALLTGCLADPVCFEDDGFNEPIGVHNSPENFSYCDSLSWDSSTETFVWEANFSRVHIHWDAERSGGSVTVSLFDAQGQERYMVPYKGEKPMRETHSNAGSTPPGEWTVKIEFSRFSGKLGLFIEELESS